MLRRPATHPYNALALLVWMALSGVIHTAHAAEPLDDKAAIRTLMAAEWDKPDAKLLVDPLVVDGDHALAGWTQGSRGGRALLRKSSGKWAVVLCSGDPLKYASALIEAGVEKDSADRLARGLAEAERQLPPQQVALFSTFEGVVHMGEHHGHDNHH